MTDDIPASSQVRPEDEAQGQKMTIYMPQGAVIIEKTEQEGRAESATQIPLEEKPTALKAGVDSVQSLGSVINIYTGDESRGVKEQSHSKALSTDSAPMNEQQALLRISEMLDVITKRLDHSDQPLIQSAQSMDSVIRNTNLDEEMEKKNAIVRDDHNVEENFVSIGYHFDWMHAFNIIFISLILFSILLPSGLHSFLNLKMIPAVASFEVAGIQRGDLLITERTYASALAVGDVVSLHDAFSGVFEVVQISQILAPGDNGVMTIVIPPRSGQMLSNSYSVNGETELYKVVKSVPSIGTVKVIIDSFYLQFFILTFGLLLNGIVHFRRNRRYSKSLRVYANQ